MTHSEPPRAPEMTTIGTVDTVEEHAKQSDAPVVRSAGIALVGSVVGGVLVIVGEVLAARLLHGQAYGLYASAITVARIGEALSVFGLPVAIFQFIPVYMHEGQTRRVIGTVYAAVLLPLAIGSVLATAVWFSAPWLARRVFNDMDVVIYVRLLALAAPFMALSEILGAITRAFGYAKFYVIVKNIIPPVVFLSVLGVMFRFEAHPLWITGAVALASIVACSAGVVAVVRVAGPEVRRARPVFGFGTLYRFASGIMLNSIFYLIFAVTGLLSVAVFLGSDSVGVYRFCLQIVLPFEMIVLAFHAAMGPAYSVLSRQNDSAKLEQAYGTALRWMAVLHIPMGIVLAWNRHDLLALMGPRFTMGGSALLILAAGSAACMCFGTTAYVLILSGRKAVETRSACLTSLLNVALAVLLVPRFGLPGAAFSTIVSLFLLSALRVWEVRRLMGIRTLRPDFLRVVAVSAGAGLGILGAFQLFGILQGTDAVTVVLRIGVMVALHAQIVWMVGLTRDDKQTLRLLARSVIAPPAAARPI